MQNKNNKIPAYVINWTDKYFHQSAFDIPLKFPGERAVNFLADFKKRAKIKLYRGVNKYNKENYTGVESWTYEKKAASRYTKEAGGKIIERMFNAQNILLDTTQLDKNKKILLGYDYKVDDKEVLIIV